jgi:hypothetical protein
MAGAVPISKATAVVMRKRFITDLLLDYQSNRHV